MNQAEMVAYACIHNTGEDRRVTSLDTRAHVHAHTRVHTHIADIFYISDCIIESDDKQPLLSEVSSLKKIPDSAQQTRR